MLKTVFIIIFSSSLFSYPQETNVTPFLKLVEEGNLDEARKRLNDLVQSNPNDPSVKFLNAILQENAGAAKRIYEDIHKNHPGSKYADASLYRLFSYYYALGSYKKAEKLKNDLVSKFPSSPYIKSTNRNLPDEGANTGYIQEELVSSSVAKTPDKKPEFNYTIQAGAFLNVNNARNLNTRFKNKGYHSEIFPKVVGGSILNVVTVGRFANKPEADKFLITLKKNYNLDGRIIPVN